eukprot:1372149-Amorphochlora_amoeboformis.AAC.1
MASDEDLIKHAGFDAYIFIQAQEMYCIFLGKKKKRVRRSKKKETQGRRHLENIVRRQSSSLTNTYAIANINANLQA